MVSINVPLPNEIIRMILLCCETPKDYLSQSLINRQWFHQGQALRAQMQQHFSRTIELPGHRRIIWNFDTRVTVIGHGEHIQRHGREECVQTFHRVGGPASSVMYLERYWQEGRLQGLEVLREINAIWYQRYRPDQNEGSTDSIDHPYEGLPAVDSMRTYQRHCIVPKHSPLPDGCDFLGEIVFQHQWVLGTSEQSEQLQRNLRHGYEPSDVSTMYELIDQADALHACE